MSKAGKTVCFVVRTAFLFLSLQSITGYWTVAAQYILAILTAFVWGISGFIEGLTEEES